MTIRDVMTKMTTTCRQDTNLAAVTALMWENDCSAVPVLAETGELAAILTDRDICIALGTRNVRASDLTARDVFELRPAVSVSPGDDIRSVLETMHEERTRRLPVVDEEGRLEGLVSIDDIVLSLRPSLGSNPLWEPSPSRERMGETLVAA